MVSARRTPKRAAVKRRLERTLGVLFERFILVLRKTWEGYIFDVCIVLQSEAPVQNRKSATKAFRLDANLLEGLTTVARREGVSENAFVQDLLSQRVKADPLIRAFPYIVLSRRSFAPILGITNQDGLEMVGLDLGRRNFAYARELYESGGMKLDLSEYMMEVLDKQAHWFETEGVNSRPERMTLRHEYGLKWSLFLKSFLIGAYEVVSHDKLTIGVTDAYVSIELPKAAR